MLPPILVGWIYHKQSAWPFIESGAIITAVGLLFSGLNYRIVMPLKSPDGFIIVVSAWTILSAAAALPFILFNQPLV